MQCIVFQHLVALDDRVVQLSSPFNSTTIYPKCDHTLYSVLIIKTKSLFIQGVAPTGLVGMVWLSGENQTTLLYSNIM
jgi:hypothetical protein